METKKNNIGLIIALIIFIVLSIILGGYLIYDKLNTQTSKIVDETDTNLEDSNNIIEKDTNFENSNDTTNTDESKSEISVVDFYFNSVAIVSEGSVYVNVFGSTPQIDDLFGKDTYQTLVATRNNYKEYNFDNFEYILADNSSFTGMKLNTNNVKKVYSYASGQALSSNYGLILLNEDKTLSIISLYSLINGKTDVTSIPELSNIESIISENEMGMVTYAIDQNGEKFNLSSYIPTDYTQF